MKTAGPSKTHSHQHKMTEPVSWAQQQEQSFFSQSEFTQSPFFPNGVTPGVQAKPLHNIQPFFQPGRTPALQLKCAGCEAEQDDSPTVQRMPAFESDAEAPMVQPKRLVQRQAEALEPEAEESTAEEADLSDKMASQGGASDDAGDSNQPAFSFAQMKLAIGRPNDRFEQEADTVADQVVAQPKRQDSLAAGIQTKPLDKMISRLSSSPATAVSPKQLQRHVQRQENNAATASDDVAGRLSSRRGGGNTLDENTRGEMESSFGADFSNVRIHTGSEATQLSQDLGAKAFTHGSDIYFNEGQYNPNSSDGKHLLAHELTHTVQQGAAIQTKPLVTHHTAGQTIQRFSISELIESIVNKVPGYTLIKVILGKSPITGQVVARTGLNIIKAVLGLLPGVGDMLFQKLQESKSATEAGVWLDGELAKLNISFAGIKALIAEARSRLSIFNSFSTNLQIIKDVFSPTWGRIKRFLGNVADKIKDFIFRGALKLVGAPVEKIMGILNKGAGTIRRIINDPIGFLGQLVRAVKGGIGRFVGNIKTHLTGGLIDWLTGAMSDLPFQLPQKFDLRGILDLVLQILGLTWQRIRAQLVKRVGEKPVALAEKTVDIVKRLVKEGPMALWEMLKEKAADIKQQVMSGIQNWAIVKLVQQGVVKLLSFLNPAGALVQAALGIYNLVMFLIENGSRIAEFVSSIFGSISEIAQGAVKPAAKFIEKAMARTVPVILNFLSRLIGLSGIGKAVSKIIKKIRKPIDRVVEKVIAFIVKQAKKLFRKNKSGANNGDDESLHMSLLRKALKKIDASDENKKPEDNLKRKKEVAQGQIALASKKIKKGLKFTITPLNEAEFKAGKHNLIWLAKIFPNTSEMKLTDRTSALSLEDQEKLVKERVRSSREQLCSMFKSAGEEKSVTGQCGNISLRIFLDIPNSENKIISKFRGIIARNKDDLLTVVEDRSVTEEQIREMKRMIRLQQIIKGQIIRIQQGGGGTHTVAKGEITDGSRTKYWFADPTLDQYITKNFEYETGKFGDNEPNYKEAIRGFFNGSPLTRSLVEDRVVFFDDLAQLDAIKRDYNIVYRMYLKERQEFLDQSVEDLWDDLRGPA